MAFSDSSIQLFDRNSDFDSDHVSLPEWWSRYTWDYVMVFEVRAEDKELTFYQRKFSMKEILTRLNAGGECLEFRIRFSRHISRRRGKHAKPGIDPCIPILRYAF